MASKQADETRKVCVSGYCALCSRETANLSTVQYVFLSNVLITFVADAICVVLSVKSALTSMHSVKVR